MIPELTSALRKAGLAVDWRELADIVWLMRARATYAAETVPAAPNAAQVSSSPEGADPPGAAPHIPSPGEMSPPQATMSSRELPSAPKANTEASTVARIVTSWQVDADAAADFSVVAPRRFALPRRREIERAIRPLMRRQRSSRRRELDVAATVDHYCDTRVLVPLLRRQEEPWLDVALVTDSGPSMTIWQDTCSAFGDLLERSGAFRRVRRWSIDASETCFALMTPTGLLHPTKELTDVAGRTLVLVLTDGISPRWVGSEVWEALSLWGKSSPTAILQLASGSAASLTTLGEGELVATTRGAATPSARLQFDYPWWVDEPDSDAAPTVDVVPLVPLTPGRMAVWARFVAGAVGAEVDAVVAGSRDAVPIGGLLPAEDNAARDLLNTSLSPRSRRLGVLLSAVDLSLDLVRIITERLIPDADLSDLAHLIAIGALVFDEDRLAFAPVAQRYFHELVTAPDALDVWIAVAPYLEATGGRSPFSLLYGENTDAVADIPGAAIAAELIERLGLARTAPPLAFREDFTASDPSTLESVDSLVVSVTSTYSDGEELLSWQYVDRGETIREYGETTRSIRRLPGQLGRARSRAEFNERATEAVRALRRVVPSRLWPGLRDITRSRERPIVVTTDLTVVPWHLLPRSQRSARWDSCIGWRSPVTVVPQRWINPYEGDLFADDFVVLLPPPGSKTLSRARQEGRDLALAYSVRPVFATDEVVPSPMGGPQVIHATVATMGSFDLRQGPLVFVNVGSTAAFATSLLEGGARAVVAPLWAVNAKAAHRVAERFYAHLTRGSTTSHAMTQVRAELASEDSSLAKTVLAFQHFGDPSLRISFAPPSSSAAADYQMAAEPTPSRLVAPSRRSVFAAALVLDLGTNPAGSQQVDDIVRWLADRDGASVDEDAVRVIRAPTERDTVTAALELLGTQSANQHKPLFLLINGIVDSARGDGPVLVVDEAPDQSAVGLRDIVLRLARLHPGGVLAVAQAKTVSRPTFQGTVLEASPHQPAPWMLVLWPAGHPLLSTITWAIDDLRRGAPVTGDTLRAALTTSPENRGRLNALESVARTLEESTLDDAGREALADVQARIEEIAQEHDPEGVLGGVTVQGSDLQRLVIIAGNEPDGVQFEPGPAVSSAASLELDSGDLSLPVIDRVSLRQRLYELVQFNTYSVLVVNGPEGSGKTFVAQILERLSSRSAQFEVFIVDLGRTPGLTPMDVVGILSHSLHGGTRLVPTFDDESDLQALALWVVQQSRVSHRPMVWVLDGIGAPGVSPRTKEFARRLALVVSREPPASLALVLLDFDDQSDELRDSEVAWEHLARIESDDVRAFVQRRALQVGSPMSDEELDEVTSQLMSGLPAGPGRLAVLSQRASEWARSADPR